MENNHEEIENHENVNNSSIQKEPKKNNSVLIIVLALIVLGLVGYVVYAKFIQKGDEPKPSNPDPTPVVTQQANNNTQVDENSNENGQQPSNNENTEINENNENMEVNTNTENKDADVYKTADGSHTLNVKDFNNKSNPKLVYDGKIISVANDVGGYYYDVGKYAVYGDGNGQCGTNLFIVNTENNTLVNLDNQKFNSVKQIGDNYYFVFYII